MAAAGRTVMPDSIVFACAEAAGAASDRLAATLRKQGVIE